MEQRAAAGRPRTGFRYLDTVVDHPGSVVAMAHRGGATHPELTGLENTLHAFRHAASLGYEYLETDVHATSDGTLLALHDPALDRLTDVTGEVARLTADDVARARISGEHAVPRMEELLEELPGCRFNVDLKSPGAVQPLADLVERTATHDRVCVGSFSGRRLAAFRRATGGRVATAASPAEAAAFLVSPSAGLARRLTRARCAVLQLPWRHRRLPVAAVTPALVRRAHRAGLHVHVWTGEERSQWVAIDDPGSLAALLDMGVDGVIVDRTDVLKDVLTGRGQWRPRP